MAEWKARTFDSAQNERYLEESELAHYGVKGMKWGVRRTPEQLGHKAPKSKFKQATDAIYSNKTVNAALNSKAGNFMRSTLYNTFDVKDFDGLVSKVGEMAKSPQGIATIAAIVVLPDPLIWAGAAAYAGLKNSGVLDMKMMHEDAPGLNWSLRSGSDELLHYGVLGMRWGVRKDEVDAATWDFLNSDRQLNDLTANEFIGSRFGEDHSLGPNFVGSFTDPHDYSDPAMRQQEDDGFNNLGVQNFFNVDQWNASSDRQRAAAYDYVTTLGCKVMNGLLRGTISDDDVASEYGADSLRAAHESIDMFSSMMDNTSFKNRGVLARRTDREGIAGLLGVDVDDLDDAESLRSLIGSRCVEPGFTSTTMVANGTNVSNYGDVKVLINAAKGSSGMYLEPAAQMSSFDRDCYEVTLNKGSVFDVAGINVDKSGKLEAIFLDLIGQEDDFKW